jgi:hypothetical protein
MKTSTNLNLGKIVCYSNRIQSISTGPESLRTSLTSWMPDGNRSIF